MIIVICGPTGVGKTKLSEDLAVIYDGIIVNADSVQIYKELNIGSAKPKKEEICDKPHYLFDIKKITEAYNVLEYQKDLRKILDENKNKNIILVGGTGLYMMAGLYDYKFDENESPNDYSEYSNEKLYEMCLEKDKDNNLHPNNRVRLTRFLNKKDVSSNGNNKLYDAIFIGLTTSRNVLYERINKRVDIMIKEGLIDEVKSLYKYKDSSRILKTAIGYKELISYLDGDVTLEEGIDLIKKNSRHYAKRQYTWFNNKMDVKWFDTNFDVFDVTVNDVINYINEK